ncbi:MAG: tetratricopeptide repeat protein [Acetobacter sp.]|nr:tetratricopeptide repeat protein [Acetobacter sp.]
MSYDLMFQKAIELQNAGALNEAEGIYLRMLQVMPENSDVWNLLGLTAQSKGDLIRAADCFLTAIKYAPRPFFAHFFNLGLVYKALNRTPEALETMKKAAELGPSIKEIWNFLGILQAETGEIENAIKSFCKALDIDANYSDAMVNLCLYTKDIEKIIKLADEDGYNFLANFKAAEFVTDAVQKEHYLQRAVAAAPERTDALLALADFYRLSESFNKSLTFYHKVLNLDDKDVSAWLGAADVYLALKDYEKAEKYYLKSFDFCRDIAGAHLNYGILLYETGRIAEALEEYRQAAMLAPEQPEISYNLALILKETGDLEEALGLLFNAHLKAPENQLFIINLSETLSLLYKENAELALKIAQNWQKQEPENIFSARLLAGISGSMDGGTDVIYSKKLFDAFAESYDITMGKLEPQIIAKFKELYGAVKGKVLDLGCGTGLAAEALGNAETVFNGVDVSAEMIAKARLKGVYNNLYQEDILTFLRNNPPALMYDLVIAFDVFCYLGDLKAILQNLKGVEVWFSIESADDNRGQDYYLTPSGRYKHRADYINKILQSVGFTEIMSYPLVLRKEQGEDVWGILFQAK